MVGKRINKYISILLVFAMAFAMAAPTGVWAEPESSDSGTYDQQAGDATDNDQTVHEAVYEEVPAAMLKVKAAATYTSDEDIVQAAYDAVATASYTSLEVGDAANEYQKTAAVKVAALTAANAVVAGLEVSIGVWYDGTYYHVEVAKNDAYNEYTVETVSFDESDAGAVALAKEVVAAADFTYLDVADDTNQGQKTAAVQLRTDEALWGFGITAAVAFADPNYVVTISQNAANDSYTIPIGAVTFVETDYGVVLAAKAAIESANYEGLEVADLDSETSSWQMAAAVKLAAQAAAEAAGAGVRVNVNSGGSNSFYIEISMNDEYDNFELQIPIENFLETDTGAVNMAKASIQQACEYDEFLYLEVGDITSQAQKNAAVQTKVDAAVAEFGVTAVVGYDSPYYAVEIYKNEAYGSYYIDNAAFVPYAPLAVAEAKAAIAAADYTGLAIHRVIDQNKKTEAVWEKVSAVVEGLGVSTSVTFVSPNYEVVICKGATEDHYTITTATFIQSDPLAMVEIKNAIEAASYKNLPVDDSTIQWKKTASVQAAANEAASTIWALGDIEATVTFSENNYIVAIDVNGIKDSYTIPGSYVTFVESDEGTVIAADYYVSSASFENLVVADAGDQTQRTAAVQAALDSTLAAAGLKRTGLTAVVRCEYNSYYITYSINGIDYGGYGYKVDATFVIAEADAVAAAKAAIAAASYIDLGVASLGNQDQNTAAVQKAVDEALSFVGGLIGVTAAVTFNAPDYNIAISKNGINDSYTITAENVTFIVTDRAILEKAFEAVSEASYNDLEVLDATDRLQKAAALQLAVEAEAEAAVGDAGISVQIIILAEPFYMAVVNNSAGGIAHRIDTATFVESEASVVKVAKGVIAAAGYKDLGVGDITVQAQKTAAVQIAVQAALDKVPELSDVTAAVTFDSTYYSVAISRNGINDNYTITTATFKATDDGTVKLARAAIAAADYTNLEVADITDQVLKTSAVQGVVDAAIAGLDAAVTVSYDAGYYKAVISKNTVNEYYYITAARFVPFAADAVSAANAAIASVSYTNLAVMDINNQLQKTAAVQAKVNAAIEGFGVTAVVNFVSPNYVVTVSKGIEEQNYTITAATFIQSTQLALIAAKEVVAAADYTNLQIGDRTNQVQKTAAVQAVVNAAIEGFGVTAAVAFVSPNYVATISKGIAKSIYTITGATFTPTNTYEITTAPVAGGTATVTVSHATAYAGDTVTVNILSIQPGKRFVSISVNGGAVPTTQVSAGAHYTFTMPEGTAAVTVTLENIPGHAANITDNNILIVGRHAFNLDAAVQAGLAADKKYNLTNFSAAIANWVHEPSSGVNTIYYRAGNKWYNLTAAEGHGLVPTAEVSASAVNGDGIYHYMNMDLVPGIAP